MTGRTNKKVAAAAPSPVIAKDEPASKGERTELAKLVQEEVEAAASPAKPKEEEEEAKGDQIRRWQQQHRLPSLPRTSLQM